MAAPEEGVFPVIANGSTIATVTINHNRGEAIKSAHAAATHGEYRLHIFEILNLWHVLSGPVVGNWLKEQIVSTPQDIQLCTFSDGSSHSEHHSGGVGLVYNGHWLPAEWTTRPVMETSRGHEGKGAWSYGDNAGSIVMEGIGVLESLYTANEEIKRHLSVLEKHGSTVQVKVTTDCQAVLGRIAAGKPAKERSHRQLPPLLYQRIREMIVALHDHGVGMVVEIRWCPRNAVTPMYEADNLAGNAMKTGLGYNKGTWSEGIRSVTMKELVPMLPGSISYTRSVPADGGTPKGVRRRNKRGKRKAEDEVEEDRPTKKAKTSHRPQTMPASWALDPDTTVYVWDPEAGEMEKKPVVSCPFVRKVDASTMETGEENVFINDGVSGFSMAKPGELEPAIRLLVAA